MTSDKTTMTVKRFHTFAQKGSKTITPLTFLSQNRDWIKTQNNTKANSIVDEFDKGLITPSQAVLHIAKVLMNEYLEARLNQTLAKAEKEKDKPSKPITVELWFTPYDKQGNPLEPTMALDDKGIPISEVFETRREGETWAANRVHENPVNFYAIIEDRRFEPPSRVKVTSSQADEAKTKKFGGIQSTHTNRSNAPKIDPFKGQKNVMRVR